MSLISTESKIVYRTRTLKTKLREFTKAPRIYVSLCDESIFENLINRRNRPTKIYRALTSSVLKEKGITVKKMRWSQYAGCSCPCSPGFILDDFEFEKGSINNFNFDVFISAGEQK